MTNTDSEGLAPTGAGETGTPTRNHPARIAYYLGVAAIVPVLGALLGPAALALGLRGLRLRNRHPSAGGSGHAFTGIILGAVTALVNWGVLIAVGVAAATGHWKD